MSLQQAAEPPNAPRNTSRASATTTRLPPANQHPRPHVFNHLPAAGNHALPSPASSPASSPQQPHTARAPAGRHHRPKAGPLPHSMVTPLHFIVPVLNPGSVPARPSPAARRGAAPWAGKHPISVEKRPRRIRHPAQISLTGSIDLQHSNTQVNTACCARRAIDKGPGSSAAPVSVSPVAVSGVKPKAVSGVTGRARAGRPGTVSRPSRRSPARLRQPYPKKLATPRSQTTTDYSASQCPP